MKTLIINGSPRAEGNTAFLTGTLSEYLKGETVIVNAYSANVSPCTDCRACWESAGCTIHDGMDEIYGHILSADAVVIASPVYNSELTPPLMGILSRMQCFYAARRFLGLKLMPRGRFGAIILTGGGDGSSEPARISAETALRHMCAVSRMLVTSLKTDSLLSSEDDCAIEGVRKLAEAINSFGLEKADK